MGELAWPHTRQVEWLDDGQEWRLPAEGWGPQKRVFRITDGNVKQAIRRHIKQNAVRQSQTVLSIARPHSHSVIVQGRVIQRDDVLSAFDAFDREYPKPADYQNWIDVGNYKHAVRHKGRLYPPKWILATAAKVPVRPINGGPYTNKRLKRMGFDIIGRPFVIDRHSYGPLQVTLNRKASELLAQGEFDPTNLEDARNRVATSIVRRQGQGKFREAVLNAYSSRCAITDCDAEAALEAAHIMPYRGEWTDHVTNGILLRADIHTLFDQGLITVDVETMTLLIAQGLVGTSYQSLQGKSVRMPEVVKFRPNREALEKHRIWSEL
jgi:hypothetical protein